MDWPGGRAILTGITVREQAIRYLLYESLATGSKLSTLFLPGELVEQTTAATRNHISNICDGATICRNLASFRVA